ncbi:DUF2231 domain-containing protein [Streptomyces mangrovisoli]|uniref:DUF2231 domain-containing protein n=1 Tax=Streptomyces mangrovisoli TaxID=1428628 RepID=A0A1J4NVG7_9ACTN|nr:DUF2231 domain-containing protein [Streptomyces mangrovisoli]OIJ66455.1 hypothetical protein WN71_018250 [Streptomyces mangrovisoli]
MNTHAFTPAPQSGQALARTTLDTASTWWLTTLDRLERTTLADPAIRALQRGIRSLPLGEARDLLRGRPLGHPVHPVLVQVPIGCWLSAAVLDVVPGTAHASTTLTAVGLVGVAPAAVTGWVDWADLPPEQARVGLAHAVTNVAAVAFHAASLTARLRGRTAKGRLWSLGGLAAVAVTGALGGHVAYRRP